MVTASVDRTIRVWAKTTPGANFNHVTTLTGHEGSLNCLAVDDDAHIIASGSADGTVRIWQLERNDDGSIGSKLLQTITITPRLFPLTMALKSVYSSDRRRSIILAVGGTRNVVQIYTAHDNSLTEQLEFTHQASLIGHESWITSLAFRDDVNPDTGAPTSFVLASASQDKYIRLWRIKEGEPEEKHSAPDQEILHTIEKKLSSKSYDLDINSVKYSVTFEALLFGHEDWIYTIAWNPDPKCPQLLSASADNSLVIWEPDPVSGVWYSASRMGEISSQKGSTTATGSAGGFWIGLWSPKGDEVVCLGRTGSWRRWQHDTSADSWEQRLGISGHVRPVTDIAWEPQGGYLLSTSTDQTSRLHAEWKRENGKSSWHEFSRPQVHGYDLNCIASLGSARFVSGADEKLLRVFDQTKVIAHLLRKLCGVNRGEQHDMAEAANIPVLGLSNQALDDKVPTGDDDDELEEDAESEIPSASQIASHLDLDHPPFEDHLSKFSLWPEHEKLYGHGYEISCVAVTNDRTIIATACKATSLDHAVIRLYDASTWDEIRPPLTAHSLTVTSLSFSPDDRYLVSVGRDRQWAIFERSGNDLSVYKPLTSNQKGHSRMILDACWAPLTNVGVFATGGRDKQVKVWTLKTGVSNCAINIPLPTPASAVDFSPAVVSDHVFLAVGQDNGSISVFDIVVGDDDQLTLSEKSLVVPETEKPSKAITQLAWKPIEEGVNTFELAVSSEDSSLRVYSVNGLHA